MTSDEIFKAIELIAFTPGKNDKTALVTEHGADGDFRAVLSAAINPLITYGVRKFLQTERDGTANFDARTWTVVGDLATRRLSGNAALLAIKEEMERLSVNSAELLKRILTKDLRAGFDANTTNKAVKGLIPVFPYMRCSLPKDMKLGADFGWKDGVISQEKADGMFMNIDHEVGGLITLRSRQGTNFPMGAFEVFAGVARDTLTPGTQTHGEMIVQRFGVTLPREEGNGILNHVAAGGDFGEGEAPLFLVWDQIPLSAVVPKGKYEVPYKARLISLIKQIERTNGIIAGAIQLIPTKVVHSMTEAWEHYRVLLANGKEGTVFKKPTAIWRDGTSREQGKLKLKAPVELRVKGFVEGKGKFAGMLGAFQCASECGELQVNVNARGDAQRVEVWANQQDWLDAVVAVEGNALMAPSESNDKWSMFLPVLVERRTDKSVADDLDRIRAQFKAAMEAA